MAATAQPVPVAVPDFRLEDGERFPGDFRILARADYKPAAEEAAYVERLNALVSRIVEWRREDAAGDPDGVLAGELDYCRDQFIGAVRRGAGEFTAMSGGAERLRGAETAYAETFRLEGIYRDRCLRATKIPFVVRTLPRDLDDRPLRPITDIEISTRDTVIPPDKQRFKLDVDRTAIVMKTVLLERRRTWRRLVPRFLVPAGRRETFYRDRASELAATRLDEYLFALAKAAEVGLMNHHPSQTPFAALALAGLKDEFVAREAASVKNDYVFRLGAWGFVLVLVCLSGYLAIVGSGLDPNGLPYRFRNFLLLATGAAVGTWLSFSLRRVVLTFADLALLEEDRLNPGFRMVFMVALTSVVGLLFWTGAIAVDIGGLSTDFVTSGSRAMLIGALCGIAERAVTTAVSRRADDFAAGIGGGDKPAP